MPQYNRESQGNQTERRFSIVLGLGLQRGLSLPKTRPRARFGVIEGRLPAADAQPGDLRARSSAARRSARRFLSHHRRGLAAMEPVQNRFAFECFVEFPALRDRCFFHGLFLSWFTRFSVRQIEAPSLFAEAVALPKTHPIRVSYCGRWRRKYCCALVRVMIAGLGRLDIVVQSPGRWPARCRADVASLQ